ncbi:hypothetical protein KP509_32G006000 [Ceratopteris richardii]|nr:hypothetical protein KP509_32G006000 [Ceratopteris richardii]
MLEATVSSVSGFPVPTFNVSRLFLGDTRANGLPQGNLDFPTQGSVYTAGSLGYPVNARSFSVPDRRLINPQGKGVLLPVGTLAFAGNYESGISNPSASVFNIGSTTSGQASTSGAVSTFIKSSAQGEKSSKRHKPYRGPKRGTLGARKRVGTDAPAAPRNTTSFLMRAKRSGGIASFVSPSPVTPAVIPTPVMSPAVTSMGLGDEANHEWGVDDYGSMNGLIRLRSLALGDEMGDEYGDTNDSESEVEQGAQSVQQLEERLDHDVSRFVMTYPASRPHNMGLDDLDIQRIDDQDSHIANLQEENMNLKERLYSMQQEVGDLRRRLRVLEGFSSGDDATLGASPDRSVANVPCL